MRVLYIPFKVSMLVKYRLVKVCGWCTRHSGIYKVPSLYKVSKGSIRLYIRLISKAKVASFSRCDRLEQ
jgi:hypothetical protein